jgi:hypothetical protein
MVAMFTPVQKSFRARGDTVAINVNTWDFALNDDFSWPLDTVLRIRFVVQETGNFGSAFEPRIRYNVNGGSFLQASSTSIHVRPALSSQVADNAATSKLLDGTGTFAAGAFDETDAILSSVTLAALGNTEVEFAITILSAAINPGDIIGVRVYNGTGTLSAYTDEPFITATAGVTNPSGGAETDIEVTAIGGGTATKHGGSTSSIDVTAGGAGIAHRFGGAEASVSITSTGGGGPADAISGGSETSILVTSTGDGIKHARGGAGSSVSITSIGGGSAEDSPISGGSETLIFVTSTGDGIKYAAGGAESSVSITSIGGGSVDGGEISGGSETSTLVTSTGGGTKHAFGGSYALVYVSSVGGVTTMLIPVTDIVAMALIRSIFGIDPTKVGTTLPKNVNNWADGFVQVVTVGGTPNIYVPLDGSVVAVSCWATNIGSGKPPWGKANQLAAIIQRDCIKHETYPRTLDLTMFGNYLPARVHSAYFVTEPHRIPSDEASYARYDGDLQINWTPLGE